MICQFVVIRAEIPVLEGVVVRCTTEAPETGVCVSWWIDDGGGWWWWFCVRRKQMAAAAKKSCCTTTADASCCAGGGGKAGVSGMKVSGILLSSLWSNKEPVRKDAVALIGKIFENILKVSSL